MKSRKGRRFFSSVLAAAMLVTLMGGLTPREAQAAKDRVLTLGMAKQSGLANSPEYEKLESQLNLKEVSLKQAVKSIKVKQKNMATFRWSPLLSFKFPEKPNLSEAYEFQFKPIQIQSEIDTIKHRMTDQVIAVNEKIATLYVEIVVRQEQIAFQEERLTSMEETLNRNRQRLKLGLASQADVDAMEKNTRAISEKIASDRRSLEADKKKLSTAIGMDITTGYTFENPLVDAKISRSKLESLTQYTLDRDESYYEASMTATTALIGLRTNYSLMQGQYGGKMGYISSYVNQAIAGQKINGKAFKKSYEEFLVEIDRPWQGNIRILFIKIPKEWFKGQISGIRYVEDEPYALYESALEYQDALLEKRNTKDALTQSVEDGFNNLVNMRNAYESLVRQVAEAKKQLDADGVLNRLGELTYEEYKSSQDDYEDLQNQMFGAMADYSKSLYEYDRLTCGGITKLLEETGASLSAGAGGESYIEEEYADGAYYYIEPIIQEQEFRLGVHIPDDFEVDVSQFELWCDKKQIGTRTEIDQPIRHLGLALDNVSEAKLRFYQGNQFVDDCIIDPQSLSGPLKIVKGYVTTETKNRAVGTYTSQPNGATGMVAITLKPNAAESIGYYRIRTEQGSYLMGDTLIPITETFRYLSLMQGSMDALTIEFYGEDSRLKYTGYFDTSSLKLMKNPEGT